MHYEKWSLKFLRLSLAYTTTWLDLPVSVQNCALTGLRSAVFYGRLCLQVVVNYCSFYSSVYLSPLLGPVLYTDMNSICLPVFILINKENVCIKEKVVRPVKIELKR